MFKASIVSLSYASFLHSMNYVIVSIILSATSCTLVKNEGVSTSSEWFITMWLTVQLIPLIGTSTRNIYLSLTSRTSNARTLKRWLSSLWLAFSSSYLKFINSSALNTKFFEIKQASMITMQFLNIFSSKTPTAPDS